jgi:hypothetical protein
MDLEDGLVLARELELDRVAMMLGPRQLLEAQCAEEGHVFLEVLYDQFDVINACDHGSSSSSAAPDQGEPAAPLTTPGAAVTSSVPFA